ncbi:glycosyltransferase [Flaviaesturariibacter flavus]|uniref:Glycosyltransferase n=1 Tax=Flaviaesturariibacter flavus TaxID=2502780 RepID=A0A4R1BB62_9BACT|nr:glycosyltransferase [Flaviaesturariibacter flavus]TCJ14187.1 glycosyltransferase [Flaviaesturariibacter flavus]
MSKLTIVHVIDSLRTGGAEILLKNTVNLLAGHRHVIVYLLHGGEMSGITGEDVEFVCLHHKGWGSLHTTAGKLRAVIKKEKASLVHSHLIVSSLIARLAIPRNTPLVTTIHSTLSIDAFKKNRLSLWAERLTLRNRHVLVGVSHFVLEDYLAFVRFSGRKYVLYNFIPDAFFQYGAAPKPQSDVLRCVAVGNLKEAKNYAYLLEVMEHCKEHRIQLDIYGEGHLRGALQQKIDAEGLPVRLCGSASELKGLLTQYDLFMLASHQEGFGISVVEAIALRLPVFISNIKVFEEVTGGHAHYFPLDSAAAAAKLLQRLETDITFRTMHVDAAYHYCKKLYNQAAYRDRIEHIYGDVISGTYTTPPVPADALA